MADDRPVPLSAPQRRIWAATQTRPGDASYNQPFVLLMDGPLDVGALRRAFDALVRRHPPLRSRVVAVPGGLHLVPDRPPETSWTAEEVAEADATAVATRFGREPVDLAGGPLLRTRLLRTGPASHRLLVNQHHIASDQRSVEVFTDELVAAYADCVAGREPSWPGEPPDYPGYWRRRIARDDERRDAATRAWSEYLAGTPEVADLPTATPRPTPGDPRRAHHDESLDQDLARRLDRLARAHRASTFMVCKAALDVVLGGYGPGDIATGVALYGRDTAESGALIGFLAEPAVLRADLRGDPTFAELVRRTRGDVLDAHERPALPLDEVLDALGHSRDPGHHPLYQVMFGLGRPARTRHAAGLAVRPELPALDTVKVDLDVGVTESAAGLDVVFSYRADLFAATTVAAMARHYRAVLRAAADDPTLRLTALRALGLPRRPVVPRPYGGGLLARFHRAAAAAPSAIAIEAGAVRCTYADLAARVERIARTVPVVRPEAPVGVCVTPGPDLVAAMLAVPRAGGVAVPVDPARPRRVLHERTAALTLVVADERCAALLAGVPTPLHTIGPATPARDLEPPDSHADRAVWVAASSGTTGTPNDVVLTNENIDRHAAPAGREVVTGPLDGIAAVWRILATICGGGHLVFDGCPDWTDAEADGAGTPGVAADVESRGHGGEPRPVPDGPTGAFACSAGEVGLPFGMASQNAAWPGLEGGAGPVPDALPGGSPGGSAAAFDVAAHVEPCGLGGGLRSGAGDGIGWSAAEVGGPVTSPSGVAAEDVALYVLDGALRPVPDGAVGHLHVGGAAVARGYLGGPGRTAVAFVADPFGVPGARMVVTGDLVRRYPDGGLRRVGRVGECVRRLGVLVSPLPAETALAARPDVAAAGVVVTGDGRLLAGVQAEPGHAERLRDDLAATLPAALVPDRVVAVDMVPLLPSGVVDRARLLAAVGGPAAPGLVRPVTPVEREVARAWRTVLGRPAETGRTFFEMGGDSVRLIRLRGLLVAALGGPIDVVELFRHPTARAMAAHLESRSVPPAEPARVGASRGARRRRTREAR